MSVILNYLHQYSCRGIFLCILVGKSGQYDDDYTPSVRMLFDDELKINRKKYKQQKKNTINYGNAAVLL
jgi:nitrogen fixation-related uncharacterized protein